MNEVLIEFKKRTIREIEENPKLLALDAEITKLESKLTGLDFEDKIFKFRKRLERLEINKFGYSLTTDDDGKN